MLKLTKKINIALFIFTLVMINTMHAQINILSANFTVYNVSPSTMCDINIMNASGSEINVIVESKLYNGNNEVLLHVKTNVVKLKAGLNAVLSANPGIALTEYSASKHAQYIKTSKTLPSGKFKFCCIVTTIDASEPLQDEYCDELESDNNNFLYLVSVPDKDEIETSFPVLIWNHSEPFNLLAANEFYRLVLVELNKDQSPDAAVTVNSPFYLKNFLTTHSIQYPVDARKLEPGKQYAWQVQKMGNGAIIDKTEAWQFSVKKEEKNLPNKYAVAKRVVDGGFYEVTDDKIYFKYDELYTGNKMLCKIKNDKNEYVDVKVKNENLKNSGTSGETGSLKSKGQNYFEFDLQEYHLKKGFYMLEIINEKQEVSYLKFLISNK
jgi:hypothetical protein